MLMVPMLGANPGPLKTKNQHFLKAPYINPLRGLYIGAVKEVLHCTEVVSVAKHLTDKQKKRIIADYATLGNYSAVARKHGVSFDTVKRVVMRDPETMEKAEQKKAENTEAVLSHLEKQAGKACDLIDLFMTYLEQPQKLERANVRDLATALGIVIDKFTGTAAEVDKLRAEIAKLRGEQKQREVHPLVSDLVAALKARQEGGHAE